MTRYSTALLLLAACFMQACGLGPGVAQEGGGAELRVTRDFGQQLLDSATAEDVRPGDTVMRFLRSENPEVKTTYGGRFLQSLDGLEGGGSGGGVDWFFYVNGQQGGSSAADTRLYPGDVVQWDYRDWQGAMDIFAIVGAYPEPFVHGAEGKKYPTKVACVDPEGEACKTVKEALTKEGVIATGAPLDAPAGDATLRVIVGAYPDLMDLRAAQPLADTPQTSGVFARFVENGGAMELLDQTGKVVDRAESLSGLVAATAQPGDAPTWFITGLDDTGVLAAARSLDPKILQDRFAVAITPGKTVALPVEPDAGG
jgi:hypothetical protein